MSTTLIVSLIVISVFAYLIIRARIAMKNLPVVEDHKNILILTDKNIQQSIKNKLVLTDFWASWCAPCKMMAPVLNEVAEELDGNSKVAKVNIEEYRSLAQKYNIRSIPTLILFKNGIEVDRFVGIKTKDYLLKQIQKHS